jgi:heme/copper-type cytochrome/quinol oxidase subunit 2
VTEGVCKYATITIMKAIIHPPVHESYKKHRQEIIWQIILPMALTTILFIALIVLLNIATFRDNADVGRWAALSTIWISIPIIIMAFVFLAVLGGIVYLLMRLLQIAPIYTGKVQDLAHKVEGHARRAADAAVKPIIELNGIGASIQAFLGRK